MRQKYFCPSLLNGSSKKNEGTLLYQIPLISLQNEWPLDGGSPLEFIDIQPQNGGQFFLIAQNICIYFISSRFTDPEIP